MNEVIERAIEICRQDILKSPSRILSESDFERMLANQLDTLLQKEKSEFSVHTQVSYYEESISTRVAYRVDILLMKEEEITECQKHHKGFIYAGESFVFELKYLHRNDSCNIVRSDMEKSKLLLTNNGILWVVVLLEKKDADKEESIKRMWQEVQTELEQKGLKEKLRYTVLYKYT